LSVYIDADAFIAWEKGRFDLPAWLAERPDESIAFPPTVWQQLTFGKFAWEKPRADKRVRFLLRVAAIAVSDFGQRHAETAARLAAELKLETIGLADFQIAACALEDDAELLTFNRDHFGRVPGLRLATV
jgi:predicted nucleic acid-binding protein